MPADVAQRPNVAVSDDESQPESFEPQPTLAEASNEPLQDLVAVVDANAPPAPADEPETAAAKPASRCRNSIG